MTLVPVADQDYVGEYYIQDTETGLLLCTDASFSFHSDDRLLSGNEYLANNLIIQWNLLFEEGKIDTP